MTILGVDHGERRLGIAVSDVTETLARPISVLIHTRRESDARAVLELAMRHGASTIVVGLSLDEQGETNPAGRRATRFAETLQQLGSVGIVLWDESLSSQDALALRKAAGASRKRRAAPIDDLAAALILQSYLDSGKLRRGEPRNV